MSDDSVLMGWAAVWAGGCRDPGGSTSWQWVYGRGRAGRRQLLRGRWLARALAALPGQVGSRVGAVMTDHLNHVGLWGQRLGKPSLREGTAHPEIGIKVSSD